MSTSETHLPVVPKTERLMVEITEAVLREREIEYAIEVPLMFFYIDLVFRDDEGELVAVEFKLHDWRRGIAQAKGHELGASRMYVCLPAPRVTETCREAAREAGVGVLAWSPTEPFCEEVRARRSDILMDVAQEWLEESFMSSLHYVRYGNHREQQFVSGKLRDTYEGLVYHANLVAGSAGGIAKFVMREALHATPFVVNPITHEFQRPPGEALEVKPWVTNLAEDYYGGPFADAVSRGAPITPEAFGDDVRGIVDRVLNFQRDTLNTQAVATQEARYLRFTQPQFALRPVALICPYLAFLHSEEQCLSVNLRLLETGLAADPSVATKLAFPRSLLTNGRFPGILAGYNELAPSRYYLWIGDFSELEVGTAELRAFTSLLRKLGGRTTNLYGGFLSMLLTHEDIALLDGVCNGPQYGEDRSLIPTTGFGSPAARFYVRDLHRRVRYRDALRLFERLGWLASEAAYFGNVCSCPTCRQLVNEHGPAQGFAQFGQTKEDRRGVPRTTGKSLVHASNHYMYAKRWERNLILNESVGTIRSGMQEAIERYRYVGQSPTAHLHRWRDLLDELRRI